MVISERNDRRIYCFSGQLADSQKISLVFKWTSWKSTSFCYAMSSYRQTQQTKKKTQENERKLHQSYATWKKNIKLALDRVIKEFLAIF